LNTKYEGRISKMGDKVIIRTRPDINIFDYAKGMSLRDKRQTPESTTVELNIDKAKAYSLNIDDIDKIQNDIDALGEWGDDGGKQLAIQIDRSILNSFYTSAAGTNKGNAAGKISSAYNLGSVGTPLQIIGSGTTSTNVQLALDVIMDADAVLSECDVPETDRWIVLPVWYCNLLQKGDLKRADVTGDTTNSVIRNGKLGQLSNFTVYKSNNLLPSGGKYAIPFGHKSALTFASQLVKNRTFPDPDSFATIQDGLQVYGWNVVNPTAMGYIWGSK
jgi:hypothetical protein